MQFECTASAVPPEHLTVNVPEVVVVSFSQSHDLSKAFEALSIPGFLAPKIFRRHQLALAASMGVICITNSACGCISAWVTNLMLGGP
jgi:hypothetical protein